MWDNLILNSLFIVILYNIEKQYLIKNNAINGK